MQAKRFFVPILMLWLLAGCSMPTFTKPSKPAQPTDPAILESRGDYAGAAALLMELAEGKKPPEQQELRLRAAEDLLRARRPEEALALLERTITAGMGDLDLHRRIVLAEVYNSRANAAAAMQQLATPPPAGAPLELARRAHEARAESYRITGKVLEAVGELSELDGILTDQNERLENQKRILQLLMPLAESTLELLQPKPPGTLGGWMELVRVMKANAGQNARLQAQVLQWRKRFPSHPALPNLIDSYFGRSSANVGTGASDGATTRIAVLLPESGPLAKAGDALRDGMMAAWTQEQPVSRPQLMFYDSGSFDQIVPLYQQAVRDGAATVVGPLAKEKVAQLLGSGNLPVPTVALNAVESSQPLPGNLVQFSLSPEDEARQVAVHAWEEGLRTALVLSPDNDWGARVYSAFNQRWRELGGAISAHQRYLPEGPDFGSPIKALIGAEGGATPTAPPMQQAADGRFIFLIAKAAQARQIRPQLQFHGAFGIPIYATSAIYGGDPNAQRDRDLNGVRFPEIPWLLRPDPQDPLARGQVAAVLPESRGDYGRLYAMGMDAFMLAVNVRRLGQQRGETFEGRTGLLHLGAQNHIERRMEWAIIDNGIPRPLTAGDTQPLVAPAQAPSPPLPGSAPGTAPAAPAAIPARPAR